MMELNNKSISVILPAYNEKDNIGEVVLGVEIYLAVLKNGHTLKEVGVNHFLRMAGLATSEVDERHLVFVKPKIIYRFLKDAMKLWRKVYGW